MKVIKVPEAKMLTRLEVHQQVVKNAISYNNIVQWPQYDRTSWSNWKKALRMPFEMGRKSISNCKGDTLQL